MVSKAYLRGLKRRLKVQEEQTCNCIFVSWSDEVSQAPKVGEVCPKCGLVVRGIKVINVGEVFDEPESSSKAP